MKVVAELSLYPLGEKHLSPAIKAFVNVLKQRGVGVDSRMVFAGA